jgi:hypothetical protein
MKKFIKHFVLSYIGIVLFLVAYTIIVSRFIYSWGIIEPNTFLFIGAIPFLSLFISLYRHDFNPQIKGTIVFVVIVIALIFFSPKNMRVPGSVARMMPIYDFEKEKSIYPTEYKTDQCFGLHFSKASQNSDSASNRCFGFVKTIIVPITNNRNN